jgi:hypothetical protein
VKSSRRTNRARLIGRVILGLGLRAGATEKEGWCFAGSHTPPGGYLSLALSRALNPIPILTLPLNLALISSASRSDTIDDALQI